jgi:5'(3')-deoxyribonucleotidase
MSKNDKEERMKGGGVKYDTGKLRFDLVPPFAQEQYVRVLTEGAKKYNAHNWEMGMDWCKFIASLERHLHAFKLGEDYDQESGLLHMAHVMCNAAFLLEYYKIFPQGDNRVLPYHRNPRIGLDIDEVLADFIGGYSAVYGIEKAESWDFDPKLPERLEELKDNKEFWMNLSVKTNPRDIPFEPICYITSRPCPKEWTVEWLHKNGFPCVPVHCTYKKSKVDIANECQLQWFVDDHYSNFVQLNEAKVFCFLFDAPHNQRYNVGFRRIKSLKELPL